MSESILLQEPVRRPLALPTSSLFIGASEVVETLRKAGFEAFLVGGSIRDLVMGEDASDCDIATNAPPKKVQKLFRKTVPVGIQFGTVMVLLNDHEYEVTTFRADGRYEDGRRPSSVSFSQKITDDLERRDLTINGLIYDPIAEEVVDYTRGLEDIDNRCIRTIGAPSDRFGEDRLRMLRAVRFAARLGFTLTGSTAQAIRDLAPCIVEVSVERIQQELLKMFKTHPTASTQLLFESGLMDVILPGTQEHATTITKWMRALAEQTRWTTYTTLATLFACIAPKEVEAQLKSFKFSNAYITRVSTVVQQHIELKGYTGWSQTQRKRFLRQPFIQDIVDVGTARAVDEEAFQAGVQQAKTELQNWTQEQLSPVKLLTGDDLKELQIPPGRVYKDILDALEEEQLEERIHTQEEALQWLQTHYPQWF